MNSEILEPRCAPARRAGRCSRSAGGWDPRADPCLPAPPHHDLPQPWVCRRRSVMAKGTGSFQIRLLLRKRKKIAVGKLYNLGGFWKEPSSASPSADPAGPLGCPHPTQGALMHVLHGNPARGEGDSRVSRGQGLSGGQEAEPHKRAPKLRQCGTAAPGHCTREGVPPLPKVRRSRHGRLVPPGPACVFGLNHCCYCCG